MTEITVTLTAGIDGSQESAQLIVCKECSGRRWYMYVPSSVGHIHFQCCRCGCSYCDGCDKDHHVVQHEERVQLPPSSAGS